MLTRRVFLRGSAIVAAGMGVAPGWLARAVAAQGQKRKTLVAIFMRGAADGLSIVAPFRRQAVPGSAPDDRGCRPFGAERPARSIWTARSLSTAQCNR